MASHWTAAAPEGEGGVERVRRGGAADAFCHPFSHSSSSLYSPFTPPSWPPGAAPLTGRPASAPEPARGGAACVPRAGRSEGAGARLVVGGRALTIVGGVVGKGDAVSVCVGAHAQLPPRCCRRFLFFGVANKTFFCPPLAPPQKRLAHCHTEKQSTPPPFVVVSRALFLLFFRSFSSLPLSHRVHHAGARSSSYW